MDRRRLGWLSSAVLLFLVCVDGVRAEHPFSRAFYSTYIEPLYDDLGKESQ